MLVCFNSRVFDIKYPNSSPYFNTLLNTKSNVDYYYDDDNKVYVMNEDWINIDDFENYVSLMSGIIDVSNDGKVVRQVSEELLDYMGHNNPLKYPNDYHNVKIHDNLIRDNWNTLEDPLYNLEDITHLINYDRLNDIKTVINIGDYYIAGGGAMYLCNVIDDMRDIDIFTTKELDIKDICNNTCGGYVSKNCVELNCIISHPNRCGRSGTIQVILRIYSSPSQIVHGFDLDCCGYCYDVKNNKLYRTTRAKYSTINKINYFDPQRSSPTYAMRLSKYYIRGINIWMPYENNVRFNQEEYEKYTNMIIYDKNIMDPIIGIEVDEDFMITNTFSITNEDLEIIYKLSLMSYLFPYISKFYIRYKNSNQDIITHIKNRAVSNSNTHINRIMPHDPVSIIFLVKNKSLFITSSNVESDYIKYNEWMLEEEIYETKLTWDKLDPMKQLSGTFFPEPIETDIMEWYKQSPLLIIEQ